MRRALRSRDVTEVVGARARLSIAVLTLSATAAATGASLVATAASRRTGTGRFGEPAAQHGRTETGLLVCGRGISRWIARLASGALTRSCIAARSRVAAWPRIAATAARTAGTLARRLSAAARTATLATAGFARRCTPRVV